MDKKQEEEDELARIQKAKDEKKEREFQESRAPYPSGPPKFSSGSEITKGSTEMDEGRPEMLRLQREIVKLREEYLGSRPRKSATHTHLTSGNTFRDQKTHTPSTNPSSRAGGASRSHRRGTSKAWQSSHLLIILGSVLLFNSWITCNQPHATATRHLLMNDKPSTVFYDDKIRVTPSAKPVKGGPGDSVRPLAARLDSSDEETPQTKNIPGMTLANEFSYPAPVIDHLLPVTKPIDAGSYQDATLVRLEELYNENPAREISFSLNIQVD